MPTCRSCQETVAKSDRFCGSCGCPDPAAPGACPQCGTVHQQRVKFCSECGAGMTAGAGAAPSAPAPGPAPAPAVAAAAVDKPSYFWPDSGGGTLFYLVILGACGFMGYFITQAIAAEEPQLELQGKEFLGALVGTVGAYLFLLVVRSGCISSGLISKPHVVNVGGTPTKKGGVSVLGILLLLFAAGATRKCVTESVRKQQDKRRMEKIFQRPKYRPIPRPRPRADESGVRQRARNSNSNSNSNRNRNSGQ